MNIKHKGYTVKQTGDFISIYKDDELIYKAEFKIILTEQELRSYCDVALDYLKQEDLVLNFEED